MPQNNISKYYLEVLLNNDLHLFASSDSGTENWEFGKEESDKQLDTIAKIIEKKDAELHILFQPLCFSLVPNVLFDAANAPIYLNMHHNEISESFVSYESLDFADIEMVYAIPKNIAQLFQKKFENAYWHSRPKALLQWIAEKSFNTNDFSMWISYEENEIMIALFKQGRLLFYNTFQTKTEKDQLYYCLAIVKQQDIDTNDCTLHFIGNNISDELESDLKKHFTNTVAHTNISGQTENSPYIYLEAMHLCAL